MARFLCQGRNRRMNNGSSCAAQKMQIDDLDRRIWSREVDVVIPRRNVGDSQFPSKAKDTGFHHGPRRSTWACQEQRTTQSIQRRTTSPMRPNDRIHLKTPKVPPDCQLSRSRPIRMNIFIFYFTLLALLINHLPTTTASPLAISGAHIHLHHRQAIPDSTGNTGNVPAPVKPSLACSPPPPTITATSSFSLSTPPPTSIPRADPTSTPNANPTPPFDELRLTRTSPLLSPGALAGIIAGSSVLLLLLVTLGIVLLRRRRRPEITEIPIRRSKLGSLLRHRMFNSPLPPSRTSSRGSSRRSSHSSGRTLKKETGFVSKESIGRPRPGTAPWGEGNEGGLLGVPQAAFMQSERESVEKDGGERWVGRGLGVEISGPRPVRPVSAEPLGRLSGMGLGMGYLK